MTAAGDFGQVGVLLGGCSSEREISFKSGRAVLEALRSAGCRVSAIELNQCDEETVLGLLRQSKIDVAFIALHGAFGEDGAVQQILEKAGIPYTGSDAKTSRITINKVLTQKRLQQRGIPIPRHIVVNGTDGISSPEILGHLPVPLVVKPACEGSSIGVTILQSADQLPEAIRLASRYGEQILIEQYISGRELTVGILDGEALPVIEIIPGHSFFDFEAKYQKGLTKYVVPAEITDTVRQKVQQVAVEAYRTLGCRDLARIDVMLDAEDQPFVLEANTIPGFTETSLLPKAARQVGIDFPELCLRIVAMASSRRHPEAGGDGQGEGDFRHGKTRCL